MKDKPFLGIFLIVLGAIFFLKALGLIQFSFWTGLLQWWPLLIILIGVAVLIKARWMALVLLFVTLLVIGFVAIDNMRVGEQRTILKEMPAESGIERVELDINYGAGEVKVKEGSPNYMLKHTVKTSDLNDPKMKIEKTENRAEITLDRNAGFFWHKGKDEWDMELSPELIYDIDMDYGASDVRLDLRNLKVDKVDIDSGATETLIFFNSYPTKVEIDTGASSIDLNFPTGYGVKIEIDGGALSTDLSGFRKEGKAYYSNGYNESGENIEIDINAGASSVRGEFY